MRYGCYANGFRLDSYLTNFRFFLLFSLTCYLHGVVLGLWLGLRLGLGLVFYVSFVSTEPTALSSYVTVTSQVAYE